VVVTAAWALLVLVVVMGTAVADDFDVVEARTYIDDGIYELDVQIDYDFSERALEALENGVPLTLEVHLQVRRADGWIWENSLVDQRLRYRSCQVRSARPTSAVRRLWPPWARSAASI
jgi:hypothetical protein